MKEIKTSDMALQDALSVEFSALLRVVGLLSQFQAIYYQKLPAKQGCPVLLQELSRLQAEQREK